MKEMTDDMLMGLPEFRKLLHLSPSGERRMRSEEPDWPPHMVLGRKVFYLREAVRDFLVRQLAAQAGVSPDLLICPAVQRPVAEPAPVPAGSTAEQPARLPEDVAETRSGDADWDRDRLDIETADARQPKAGQ